MRSIEHWIWVAFATVTALTAQASQPAREVSRQVDAIIASGLAEKGLTPAPRADDAELVRRLYLDLVGRIPTPGETQAFCADQTPDKHHLLIDALLTHEEGPVHWSRVVDGWLNDTVIEGPPSDGFLKYLEYNLGRNRPWNELASELLAPSLESTETAQASYFLASRLKGDDKATRIDNMTTAVASGLFGVQLHCAKCHDHPFVSDWKQDRYYGLAASLSRLESSKWNNVAVLKEKADGELTFTTVQKEEKTARPMFLDGHVFDEPKPPVDKGAWYAKGEGNRPDMPHHSRRQALVDYTMGPGANFLARAVVNRVWRQLMGRGLVEPVDQMHTANRPTHPEVLDRLSQDMTTNGFDLRRLMGVILHSDAYLRSSRWPNGKRPADADYAAAILKPLSPLQLTMSVAVATGQFQSFAAKLEREKANRKLEEVTPAVVRAHFVRERDVQEFAVRFRSQSDVFEASASQALFLSYNALVRKQLQPGASNLVQQVRQAPAGDAVRLAYLAVLSREPSAEELAEGAAYLKPSSAESAGEFVWALLCSAEFRFCH